MSKRATHLTQKQLSEVAGVSQMTVSYAFNQPDRVAPRTLKRVLDAAREHGYRPNSAARAQRSGRFGAVGLLFRWSQGWLPVELQRQVAHELMKRRMHLHVGWLPDDEVADQVAGSGPGTDLPRILREACVDGLLIHYAIDIPQHTADLVAAQGVPVVWLDTRMQTDCVSIDEYGVARIACEKLLELGHRRIAFDTHHAADATGTGHWRAERERGFERPLCEAGLAPMYIRHTITWDMRPEQWTPYLRALTVEKLRQPDRPTAIITDRADAAGRILMAATQLGLRVPEDLSLIAFHDEPVIAAGMVVDTVQLRFGEMATRAMQMLDRKLQEPDKALPPETIAPAMREGETVAPSPQ